jgi:integrase
LSTQAVAELRELQPLTGAGLELKPDAPRYVFPGARSRLRPMSENAVTAALRSLGYTGEQMTGHGFRATARTLLAEMGWMPDIIERQLAHKPAGPLGAAYDRAAFLVERRKLMQAWADHLDGLRECRNVVALRAA